MTLPSSLIWKKRLDYWDLSNTKIEPFKEARAAKANKVLLVLVVTISLVPFAIRNKCNSDSDESWQSLKD